MLKETIKFKDYNDQDREVTEYFHLNEAEIVDMQAKSVNGIQADMQHAILSNDAGRVLDFIKMLVHKSYGKKSADGINFDKSPEILNRFISSAYYSDFLLGLIQDNGQKGQEFVQGIMPAKLVKRAMEQVQGQQTGEADRTVYGQNARETFAAAQASRVEPEPPSPIDKALGTVFDQPNYPQFAQQGQPPVVVTSSEQATHLQEQNDRNAEFERFRQWQAEQEAAKTEAPQGLPRPPHEQMG